MENMEKWIHFWFTQYYHLFGGKWEKTGGKILLSSTFLTITIYPKQYLPTNPLAYQPGRTSNPDYDLKTPNGPKDVDPMRTFKPPLSDFRPPSEIDAPIKANGYIPPAEPTSAYSPPDKDYLPPKTFNEGKNL